MPSGQEPAALHYTIPLSILALRPSGSLSLSLVGEASALLNQLLSGAGPSHLGPSDPLDCVPNMKSTFQTGTGDRQNGLSSCILHHCRERGRPCQPAYSLTLLHGEGITPGSPDGLPQVQDTGRDPRARAPLSAFSLKTAK